jgi:hypothetical protein
MHWILTRSHDRRATARRVCGLARVTVLALLHVAIADATERWYRLELDGQPAGHVHEISAAEGLGTRTQTTTVLTLDRDGNRIDLTLETQDLEQGDHLIAAQFNSQVAGDRTEIAVQVEADHLNVTASTSAGHYQRQLPLTAPTAGPEYIRLETLARLQQPGDQFQYTELLEDTADIAQVTRTLKEERVGGQPFRIEDQLEQKNHRVLAQLDADGYLLESAEDSPLGRLVTRRSADALFSQTGPGARIPVAAAISLPALISQPRQIRRLTLRLAPLHEPLDPADFTGPGQIARVSAAEGLALTIELPGRDPASLIAPTAADIEPNALFPSDAPELRTWAHELAASANTEDARIRATVVAVHQKLTFDAGFAVANALDVLHRGRGTCVAYATLTAALLRANGLPSRVVYGYAYAEGALVGHAWTEVWTHRHWRAVDAALYADDGMDAARIALARSDGATGLASGLEQLSRTFGRFTVTDAVVGTPDPSASDTDRLPTH